MGGDEVKLHLKVDDKVYERYEAHASSIAKNGVVTSPEDMISAQLERFSAVGPADRIVIIHSNTRQ